MANPAVLWSKVGRLEDAAELELQVLELRKASFGARHPKTVLAMNNLALTRWQQKRYDEAKALMEQTPQLYEEVLGKEHPDAVDAKKALSFMREPAREKVEDIMIEPETEEKGESEHELHDENFKRRIARTSFENKNRRGLN